jgi:DNA-binding NtrC family response regulator
MSGSRPRVLIVEHDEVLRVLMFTILRRQPLRIDTARSASEALDLLSRCDYSVVVIDLDPPETVAQLSEQAPALQGAVVLGIRSSRNASGPPSDFVVATLNKPLELDVLVSAVRECASISPHSARDCSPAESEIRSNLERGTSAAN